MKNNLIISASFSYSITTIILTFVIALREFVKPFSNFITSLTGHHWVTKSFLVIVVFLALTFILNKRKGSRGGDILKALWSVVISVAISFVEIWIIFTVHFMK
jgi:hypothetical protein